ncbi:MAG: hypothetical protein JNM22_11135 [Saprospiraceae bacterium]|nr:hypothetical protein [Saprospiraceae bacterium]
MNLTNTQFVFQSKTKSVLIGGMVLGALCLILTFIGDDEYHTRFWSNYLHNTVFFTGIAFTSMFFLSAQITAFAGWNSLVKRVWESMSQFMMVGLVLVAVLVIGVWGHIHHLYHWNTPGITDPNSPIYDHIIDGKSGFLNARWYTLGTLGFLAVWFFWSFKLRQASIAQDTDETPSLDYYKKQRKWAASFLPLGGFLSTVFIWQSVMSIDPHWYSTMFAWYSMISMWLGGLSMTVMLIIYLKSQGYLEYVTRDHLHDIGKYLFGISVFWTYLWFDQFMLIWYANNGEETIYFKERMNHYPVLFWGNLLLNFVTPFLILMRNDTKRKFGTMFFVAVIVFFGHWWDYFYMIKPGARIAAHEAKEISEGKVKTHEATSLEKAAAEPKMTTTEAHSDATATATPAAEGEAAAHHEDAAAHAAAPAETQEAPAQGEAAHAGNEHGEDVHGEDMHDEAAHAGTEHGEDVHGEEHGHEGDKSFKAGFTLPGFLELGTLIGFLSLFLFFFFNKLSSASLVPWKDPYLEESKHHETGALINTEVEESHGHDDHH